MYGVAKWSISVRVASRPSLRINKDRLSPVLACNYDGTKPGIPWIGDPSYLVRCWGSPLGRNQFGINVTSCGINVVESCWTETARSLTRNFAVKNSQEPIDKIEIYFLLRLTRQHDCPVSRTYFFITLCTMWFL